MPSTSNGISNGHHYDRKEARKEALELNNRRNELENEIKEYMSILDSQGIGMNEPLVDSEGYPRNDLDIYQIRFARNRIICLQNDLKGLMKQMEERILDYFDDCEN